MEQRWFLFDWDCRCTEPLTRVLLPEQEGPVCSFSYHRGPVAGLEWSPQEGSMLVGGWQCASETHGTVPQCML